MVRKPLRRGPTSDTSWRPYRDCIPSRLMVVFGRFVYSKSERFVSRSQRYKQCDKTANWRQDDFAISLEKRKNHLPSYWFVTDRYSHQ